MVGRVTGLLALPAVLAAVVWLSFHLIREIPEEAALIPDVSVNRQTKGAAGHGGAAFEAPFSESEPVRERMRPAVSAVEAAPASESANKIGLRFGCRVQTEEGTAVMGAKVRLFRTGQGRAWQEGITDRNGRSALPEARPGDVVRIEAEGFLGGTVALKEGPWPAAFIIVLERAAFIMAGAVVDDRGRPVAGAEVILLRGDQKARTLTLEDGSFALTGFHPPPGEFEAVFQVAHEDYCFLGQDTPVPVRPGKRDTRLTVHRWASLQVRLTDEGGVPLPGVALCVAGPPGVDSRFDLPGSTRARIGCSHPLSDSDLFSDAAHHFGSAEVGGQQVINRVPPLLPLWLVAEKPGFERVEKMLCPFQPGETRQEALTLGKSGAPDSITFVLAAPDGDPVIDAEVWYASEEEPGRRSSLKVKVGRDGAFRIVPRTGTWSIAVSAPGYAPLHRTYHTHEIASDTIRLLLEAGEAEIVVMVNDRDGEALDDHMIRLIEEGPGDCHRVLRTDREGLVRFRGLDPSACYTVIFGWGRPGEYFSREDLEGVPSPGCFRGVRPDGPPLRFRVVPNGSIQGKVVMDGTKGNYMLLSHMDPDDLSRKPAFTVGSILDAEGGFYFTGLPPGRYHLWMRNVTGGGSFFQPLAACTLGEGERLRDLEMTVR